jgi:large subunit ribosomal protein L19
MNTVEAIEREGLRDDLPEFAVGDNVNVTIKVVEGDRERTQVFAGTVISKKGSGLRRTFTVRKIIQGEGVERVFPLYSPSIVAIEVSRQGHVRRSKLYYLRNRVGKATKVKEALLGGELADAEEPAQEAAGEVPAEAEPAETESESE